MHVRRQVHSWRAEIEWRRVRVPTRATLTIGLLTAIAGCPNKPGGKELPDERTARPTLATMPMEPVEGLTDVANGNFIVVALAAARREGDLAYAALQRALIEDVQRYARRMLDDDASIRQALIQAGRPGAVGPAGPFISETRPDNSIVRLASLTGSNFDRAYMEFALRDCRRTAAVYETAALSESDPAAREVASRLLPIIRRRLRLAREAAARVGVVLSETPVDTSERARSIQLLTGGS